MRSIDTMKIIEVVRLWEQGYTQREIALSVNCSKTTVASLQKRLKELGLKFETAKEMTDEAINKLVYPSSQRERGGKKEPDWQAIQKRLDGNKRLNLQFLWEEYRETEKDGLCRSQFYARYTAWKAATGKEVVMVQEREPGKELFVDWMGDTLECVLDCETGKMAKAHFFAATLGDSGYPAVIAFPNQKSESWIAAHVETFNRLGGLPKVVVPDNCKTAVSKANYYDPELNKAYYDLALYYNIAVIPARVRSPRDKGQVESCIGWMETWLLGWLKGEQFSSFAELNAAIKSRTAELVKRPFQKRAGSRESVFLEIDRPALRPLPNEPFVNPAYVERRVPNNYHVEYAGFYYSVPHQYYKQQVTVKATYSVIEVYAGRLNRIAIHERRYTGGRYVTERSHMPSNHQAQQDANRFDGRRFRNWAWSIGPDTFFVIDSLLKEREVEEAAYRSCMGILQFSRKAGNSRLEAACSKARHLGNISYTVIRNILKNRQEQTPLLFELIQSVTPVHENLRGETAFV
jgi:transposase